MEKDARIYIAGHRGLVGSALVRRLKAGGYGNLIFRTHSELDLMNQGQVEAFFKKERPQYVLLAAAKVGGILANSAYPADFIYQNLAVQTNVIHASYLFEVKKLLFLGSSCIYPKYCPQPMKEEYLLDGKLEPTNEPYAVAKIAGIKMCQAYHRQYMTKFISVMPTNLYGPNDNFDLETSHVLPALIRKIHEARMTAETGQKHSSSVNRDRPASRKPRPEGRGQGELSKNGHLPFLEAPPGRAGRLHSDLRQGGKNQAPPSVVVWGSGKPLREFLHVDDMAHACVFLMERYEEPDIVNIGTGKDISIKELALLVKDIVGFEGDLVFDKSKPDGMPRKLLDVSKLTGLGWKARISLEQGIRQTYEWYAGDAAQNN